MNKQIKSLYEHFKNTPKKLKIVCDWNEVIQACEPYALWKVVGNGSFPHFFKDFWKEDGENEPVINYSPYGSKLKLEINNGEPLKKQQEIKNSPNFYQEAPFLTIAEDLLKLIKEDKIEKLIFLSAYDKRKFPNILGDMRKPNMLKETFGAKYPLICSIQLIPFDSEIQGQSKSDWIKENASDFDIVIDDNPYILREIEWIKENLMKKTIINSVFKEEGERLGNARIINQGLKLITIAPHYPAVENQHDERILLVECGVSDLKREDFSKNY